MPLSNYDALARVCVPLPIDAAVGGRVPPVAPDAVVVVVAVSDGLHVLAVLEAEHLGVVGLDLAQLVHELKLVNSDVARAVARSLSRQNKS